jgi:predicted MPP superfamily phosphohydrolase
MLGIYGGANFYTARRLYQWLVLIIPQINAKIYAAAYILIAVSFFLSFAPLPPVIKRVFNVIGSYYWGIFMYLLLFLLLADAIVMLGSLTRIISSPTPRNVLFFKGLTAAVLTFGVVCYGVFNANQIKHVSYEVALRDASLDGMRIVLIADSHLGSVNSFERNLEGIVQTINGLNPDIVCWAGDIFNDDFNAVRDPGRAAALIRGIDSTYGVFACLGNHDGGATLPQMKQFLIDSNITLLNDGYVIIDGRVALFGRLDSSPIGGFGGLERRDISETIASISENMPVIVMEHNPSHIKEYGSEADLLLTGHSHRGQMFPGSLITRAMFVVDYGHYQADENSPHVIATSGVSTWGPPMRVGTKNEIVSIRVATKEPA